MLPVVASCGALPLLLGSEVCGDHSMKTRDAGGTCRAGHAAAPHQSECTCSVVGGTAGFCFYVRSCPSLRKVSRKHHSKFVVRHAPINARGLAHKTTVCSVAFIRLKITKCSTMKLYALIYTLLSLHPANDTKLSVYRLSVSLFPQPASCIALQYIKLTQMFAFARGLAQRMATKQ